MSDSSIDIPGDKRGHGRVDSYGMTTAPQHGPPPAYDNGPTFEDHSRYSKHSQWYNPRTWSRRAWIIAVVAFIVSLIVIIVGAVLGVRANRYPNYSKLNYSLVDTYSGSSFFDNFNYFSGADPSLGFAVYLTQPEAVALNLTSATSTSAVLKVDTTQPDATQGRRSVRIESKKQYNSGLFIFDVAHTPFGCGTWPALWLSDSSNWPMNGEIDVMEQVNTGNQGNQMTLHTTKGCSMDVKRKEEGKVLTKNCYNGTDNNAGCGVLGDSESFGEAYNAGSGGWYAMEWRSAGIRVWNFPRTTSKSFEFEPANLNTSAPDPSTWPEPLADFPSTECSISSHFRNASIIANIDLCGAWAGQPKYFTQQSKCPGLCTDYVAQNPSAFEDAFWEFRSIHVFQAS